MKKLILVVLLLATVARAETYKWTDAAGTVHFSESSGEIPSAYRKNARPLGIDINDTPKKSGAASFGDSRRSAAGDGSIAPRVDELKERMMRDEGTMAIIRALQDDPEMKALLNDPEILRAIQAGDIGALAGNPAFMKLLDNPRVRDIEKRMQQGGTK